MIPFALFFIIWLLFFSTSFKLLGVEVPTDEYAGVSENMAYFIWTYRNVVGDISAPADLPRYIWLFWIVG